jgi:uncharacterized protein (TIGR00369 family)
LRTRTVTWDDPKPARLQARRMAGTEFFDAMRRGQLPEPPFGRLLGMDLFDCGEGRFTMTLQPQECHYNPMGCVHGGILATLLDSVMAAAVHTALPAGKGYLTLQINVNFIKPVFERTGEILAEGKLISCGRQVATAEGRIIARDGNVYATATTTCLIMEGPPPARPAGEALEEPELS